MCDRRDVLKTYLCFLRTLFSCPLLTTKISAFHSTYLHTIINTLQKK